MIVYPHELARLAHYLDLIEQCIVPPPYTGRAPTIYELAIYRNRPERRNVHHG